MKSFKLCYLLLMIPFIMCSHSPLEEKSFSSSSPDDYDFHFTGNYNGNLAYWNGDNVTVLGDYDHWSKKDITVYNGDVYIVGSSSNRACYWKNGEKFFLPGKEFSSAHAIFISDRNLYIAGKDSDTSLGPSSACYWKNGKQYSMPSEENEHASGTAIFVKGSDVYLAGNSNSSAWFWKNNEKTEILTGNMAFVQAIAVNDNGVYVGGTQTRFAYDSSVAYGWYWHDGEKHNFFNSDGTGYITSINVSDLYLYDNDLYIVGGYLGTNQPLLIVNGQIEELDILGPTHQAISLQVLDDNIIIGGEYWHEELNTSVGCYWFNGEIHTLAGGGQSNIQSMFVTRK